MSFAADLILAQDGDVVVIPLPLARAIGLPAAAFLRQAAYLSAVVQKKDGWFFLEQEGPGDPNGEKIFQRLGSWQHALGIGPRAQATIRQQLMSLGLLEETRRGTVHGKLHYRVDPAKYLNFLAECGRATDCINGQTAGSDCTNCGEQVHKQQDAGCTTVTPQSDIYKVDSPRLPTTTHHQPVVVGGIEDLIEAGVWAEGLTRPIRNETGLRRKIRTRLLNSGPNAEDLHALRAWSVYRERVAAELTQQERESAAAASREQQRAARAAQVDAFIQSLDAAAHTAIVKEFGEWLATHNKVVFQCFRGDGLKSKFVLSEFKNYIHSHYFTQQEVAA